MLFAVHLSDSVITGPGLVAGWVAAIALVVVASWKLKEAEIPRIGVLTAAFFVGSQIHLPAGVVSAHLLLNGLLGVVLGIRSGLAIAVGLFLQAFLFAHGGKTTLGVNIAIYVPPAMIAGLACGPFRRSGVVRVPVLRYLLVFVATVVVTGTMVLAIQWLRVAITVGQDQFPNDPDGWWLTHPVVAVGILIISAIAAFAERWLEEDPEFAVGLLLGGFTSYATVALTVLWLAIAGYSTVKPMAAVVLFTNLPVILVEAIGVGFVVAFLARARPEWVGGAVTHSASDSGKTSSNGTSH